MLEAVKRALGRRASQGAGFDPSSIGDPVALETEWNPAKSGGASFCTHRLVQVSANRVEFSSTIGARVFYLAFCFAGAGVLLFQLNGIRIGKPGFAGENPWVPLLVGAIFAVVGVCLYWFGTAPRVFDRAQAAFWRGRNEPTGMGTFERAKNSAPLSEIHALQLVTEFVSGQKNSYYSYELNLVLTDGSRINVVDHGNLDRLRSDAGILSLFLDRPVWDATGS